MARITQQTMIALYGEVLTLLEIVELAHDEALNLTADDGGNVSQAHVMTILQNSRALATRATSRAVDTMLDRFPKMELHPLTGDVLDPPQV